MNLPNKLTILRILLVPLIAAVYLISAMSDALGGSVVIMGIRLPYSDLIVLGLFVLASVTDFFDGHIARRDHLITSFGKFVDPIADKLLVNTLLILLAWSSRISVIVVLLMIGRDTIVDGLRMSAASSGKVVAAGPAGKVKTVAQMTAIILVLLHDLPFAIFGVSLSDICLWIATAASLYSGAVYFLQLKDIVMETM